MQRKADFLYKNKKNIRKNFGIQKLLMIKGLWIHEINNKTNKTNDKRRVANITREREFRKPSQNHQRALQGRVGG